MVHTPAHSGLGGALSYSSDTPMPAGTLVRVPLGARELLGVVWDSSENNTATDITLRAISHALEGVEPMNLHWRQLVQFAAHYYQRSVGEVALAALPNQLRELSAEQWARRLKRKVKADVPSERLTQKVPEATPEQREVLAHIATQPGPFLLFGNTGSGKTEVYLRAACRSIVRTRDTPAACNMLATTLAVMGTRVDRGRRSWRA